MAATNAKQSQTPWFLLGLAAVLLLLRVVFPESSGPSEAETGLEIPEKVQWLTPDQVPANPSKPLLYDFTARWCAPCRQQAKEVFADEKTAAFINEHFLPVKVADERRSEKAVAELFGRYGVGRFPTLVVADRNGQELARQQGYSGKRKTEAFLKKALEKAANHKASSERK
ncbi:Thioredoxin [bacterium HR09]|nr:Thioredoxin [bacterium HR09]